MAMYTHLRPIAFLFSTYEGADAAAGTYLGNADADLDLARRCDAMIGAIREAAALEKETAKNEESTRRKIRRARPNRVVSRSVLKVFMAPEFFFRGSDGAYPLGKEADIMERMRKETGKKAYKDWLFVLGTAITYLSVPNVGNCRVLEKLANGNIRVECSDGGLLNPEATLKYEDPASRLSRIATYDSDNPDGTFILRPQAAESFPDGWVSLTVEVKGPDVVEIHNTALVQRGGPAPKWQGFCANGHPRKTFTAPGICPSCGNPIKRSEAGISRRDMIVLKEQISSVDFVGQQFDDNIFYQSPADGGHRAIVAGRERTVREVAGSREREAVHRTAADDANVNREISSSGMGGQCVFTIDDITTNDGRPVVFGLEVCLDHAVRRLATAYENAPLNAYSRPQMHLVSSCGMSLTNGSLCVVPNGIMFLVDGRPIAPANHVVKRAPDISAYPVVAPPAVPPNFPTNAECTTVTTAKIKYKQIQLEFRRAMTGKKKARSDDAARRTGQIAVFPKGSIPRLWGNPPEAS